MNYFRPFKIRALNAFLLQYQRFLSKSSNMRGASLGATFLIYAIQCLNFLRNFRSKRYRCHGTYRENGKEPKVHASL